MMIFSSLSDVLLYGVPEHMGLLIDIISPCYTLEGHDWYHPCLVGLDLLYRQEILHWLECFNLVA